MAEPNEAAPLPTPVDPGDPRAGLADVTGQWTEMHNRCHDLVADLRGARGTAPARPAGDDTARPAGWESSDRAAMLAIREGRVPADRAAAGPRAGDTAPAADSVEPVEGTTSSGGPVVTWGYPDQAGDTAPDDAADPAPGARRELHDLARRTWVGHAEDDCELLDLLDTAVAAVLDRTDAEMARLRSEAAALRAAGDELAGALDTFLVPGAENEPEAWIGVVNARDAWRSAAGSPTTDGQAPAVETAAGPEYAIIETNRGGGVEYPVAERNTNGPAGWRVGGEFVPESAVTHVASVTVTQGAQVAAPADDTAPLRGRLVEALGFDHDWDGDDDSLIAYASEQVAQADHCRTRHPVDGTAAPDTQVKTWTEWKVEGTRANGSTWTLDEITDLAGMQHVVALYGGQARATETRTITTTRTETPWVAAEPAGEPVRDSQDGGDRG